MDAISDVSRGSEIFSSVPEFPPLPRPVNLDDLFGFSLAARKKLVEETVEAKYFITNKVFVNQVDSFTGRHITSLLSRKNIKFAQQDFRDVTNQNETKEEAEKIDKIYNKSKDENNIHNAGNDSNFPLKDPYEYFEGVSPERKCIYDTSKLTVAEYYDMMELESIESRNEFLKEKLGKCSVEAFESDILKNAFNAPYQTKISASDDQTIEFEIIGTLRNSDLEDIDGVSQIIQSTYSDPEFLKQILTCGIVIYCVNEDLGQVMEANWVLNYIVTFIRDMKNNKYLPNICSPIFVLVSTFMTWSLTKPLTCDEELPFIERDYRKRKPHPNYKDLYELEELIIKVKFENIIKTVIISCGILYGHEENELRYLFEKAYHYKHVPIFCHGSNHVPMIHVETLGQIIKQVIHKKYYGPTPFIFAKDPVQTTMADISKAISLSLGTGYCELQSKEAAFINNMISQDVYDKVTNKIYLESCYPYFKEEDLQWKYKSGFVENVDQIVKEYIDANRIKPLRIILYGVLDNDRLKYVAQNISKYYSIPYICPKNMFLEYVDEILKKQARFEDQKTLYTSEALKINYINTSNPPLGLIFCGNDNQFENDLEILKKLNVFTSEEVKVLPEQDLISVVTRRLKTNPYVYHGYIMEEYPQNVEDANVLFFENSSELSSNSNFNDSLTLPDIVIFFNKMKYVSSEEKDLLGSQLQENEQHDTRMSESLKPLEEAKLQPNQGNMFNEVYLKGSETNENAIYIESKNGASKTNIYSDLLSFFTQFHKHLSIINLDISESEDKEEIFDKARNLIHKLHFSHDIGTVDISSETANYQSTINISTKEDKTSHSSRSQYCNTVNTNADRVREAEEITLATRSYSLISYLINFISPTLTNGILEVTTQMSEDPIDTLAEYIFKNNPDGRMMSQNELKLEELMRSKKKPILQIDSKVCLA